MLTQRLVEESERRAAEAQRLKEELLRARLAEKQAKEKLLEFIGRAGNGNNQSNSTINQSINQNPPSRPISNANSVVTLQQTLPPYIPQSANTPPQTPSPASMVQQTCYQQSLMLQSINVGYTVASSPEDLPDVDQLSLEIEKSRSEYLEKSKHLQEQLRELRTEIEVLKVSEKNNDLLDQLHEEQVNKGETKYSTLRRVKSGSAKSRVAFFEEL